MCITGPKNGDVFPFAVLGLVGTSTLMFGCITVIELRQDDFSTLFALYLTFTTFLGLSTILAHLSVQCSDPGILFMFGRKNDDQVYAWAMDLDEQERQVFHDDKIYNESSLYHFRHCETCMHERVPKSSHCGACGHCVIGFDHHCMLLNNCVGRRNMRSFVSFLLLSTSFAITVFLACVRFLTFGRAGYCEHNWIHTIGLVVAFALIALLQHVMHRMIKTRGRKNKILIAIAITYFASTLAMSRSVVAAISFVLIAVSTVYVMIFYQMVLDYIDMVTRKLT